MYWKIRKFNQQRIRHKFWLLAVGKSIASFLLTIDFVLAKCVYSLTHLLRRGQSYKMLFKLQTNYSLIKTFLHCTKITKNKLKHFFVFFDVKSWYLKRENLILKVFQSYKT